MLTATIFDIQRNSYVDGPGIRTTVFFKGCNLRCAWCHNPESQSAAPQMMFYKNKCTGCGKCKEKCPNALESCNLCGRCTFFCPHDAREICGKEYTVQDVLHEVMQDVDYYAQSGGGVTLSGGEVLLQPQFAAELLSALHKEGVHTAIESNLNVDFSTLEALLPDLDLVMCDLKLWDEDAHRRWTGAGNARIRENIARLSRSGKPFIVRTPVIPGVNDSEAEIAAIAGFVGQLPGLAYYELLNFNPLGGSKYQALDVDNAFAGARPLSEERMQALQAAAQAVCPSVRVG